jgi:hypothetical protein
MPVRDIPGPGIAASHGPDQDSPGGPCRWDSWEGPPGTQELPGIMQPLGGPTVSHGFYPRSASPVRAGDRDQGIVLHIPFPCVEGGSELAHAGGTICMPIHVRSQKW